MQKNFQLSPQVLSERSISVGYAEVCALWRSAQLNLESRSVSE